MQPTFLFGFAEFAGREPNRELGGANRDAAGSAFCLGESGQMAHYRDGDNPRVTQLFGDSQEHGCNRRANWPPLGVAGDGDPREPVNLPGR